MKKLSLLRMLACAAILALPPAVAASQHQGEEEQKQQAEQPEREAKAQEPGSSQQQAAQQKGQQENPDPYARANNSWISISGTVKNVQPDRFTLDYGKGIITVEMDDGDRDADAYKLLAGDKVTVNGRIDDDLYEMAKIEAGSVYVEKLGTTFYASAIDEEDFLITYTSTIIVPSTIVQGTVISVEDDEFVIDTGLRDLRVETEEMSYNPLDDEGYQRIGVGDVVSVSGTIDADFFEGRELVASSVIKLVD